MKKALLAVVSIMILLPFNSICQDSKHIDLHTITIGDYQKMSDESKATVKRNLEKAIKADTNFIIYNKLESLQTKAYLNRDRSKITGTINLSPKGKVEWINFYKQKGIADPDAYYNRGVTANKHLFAVCKEYPLLSHLNSSDRTEIIKSAMEGSYNVEDIMPSIHH